MTGGKPAAADNRGAPGTSTDVRTKGSPDLLTDESRPVHRYDIEKYEQEALVERAEIFLGPLPHPGHLRQYDEIVPGAADHIIRMAEATDAGAAREGRFADGGNGADAASGSSSGPRLKLNVRRRGPPPSNRFVRPAARITKRRAASAGRPSPRGARHSWSRRRSPPRRPMSRGSGPRRRSATRRAR